MSTLQAGVFIVMGFLAAAQEAPDRSSPFTAVKWDGDKPLVVSYASSPPVAVYFSDPRPKESPIGTVLDTCFDQVELAGVLVVQLLDDAADALLGDVGDGRVVLTAGWLGELDEDELAVAAVLLVQVEDGVGGGAGAGETVNDQVVFSQYLPNERRDQL